MAFSGRIRIGQLGRAAVYEFRGLATRILGHDASPDEALDVAARFLRAVDPREREKIENGLRRELGPRLTIPGRPP